MRGQMKTVLNKTHCKLLLSIIIFFVTITSAGNIANISFEENSWQLDNGATISGDTLTIIGDKSRYIKARLTVPFTSTIQTLYLSANVNLTPIDGGPETHKTAKFKLLNATDSKSIQAFNMPDLITDQWYTTGMAVQRFNTMEISSVIVEFSVQNASGTMKISAPKLTDTPPEANYTFPFDIPVNPSLHVDISNLQSRPFPPNLLSINSHFVWAGGDWGDSEVRQIIKERLPLGNLRFPGGTVGNFYDWTTDGFFGDEWTFLSPSRKKAYEEGFRFGFSEYASLCKESGATSTLMFNVIQDAPATAAARLQNRLDAGITIDWVEMGNENFFTEQAFGNVATMEKYISHTKALNKSLKEIDPTIKTAVNLDHHDWGEDSWTATLAKESYFDAAILHPYVQTNTFMVNNYAAKIMLSAYKKTRERVEKYDQLFPNTPLLCTEWGVLSENSPSNFLQALATADIFLALLEENDRGIVQQMGLHMLYHSDRYSESTCYFRENGKMKRTKIGVVYEKLVNFFTGNMLYDTTFRTGELESGLPGVTARAVRNDLGQVQILVVNKLPVQVPVSFVADSFKLETFTEELIGDSTSYGFDENPWNVTNGTGNSCQVPSYSIAVITIPKGEISTLTADKILQENIILQPHSSGIKLQLPTTGSVELINMSGRILEKHKEFNNGIIGKSLPKGIYLLRSRINSDVLTRKVFIK